MISEICYFTWMIYEGIAKEKARGSCCIKVQKPIVEAWFQELLFVRALTTQGTVGPSLACYQRAYLHTFILGATLYIDHPNLCEVAGGSSGCPCLLWKR